MDKPFINQGGGAVTGVRVILIPAVFVDGDGPVATEEFSAKNKKKKKVNKGLDQNSFLAIKQLFFPFLSSLFFFF